MLPLARGLGAWYLGKDLQHNCFGARQNHMEHASFMRLRLFFITQYCENMFGFVTGLHKCNTVFRLENSTNLRPPQPPPYKSMVFFLAKGRKGVAI